jgi:hypothetical protein
MMFVMETCPDCGWRFQDVTAFGPDADRLAEYVCGCSGRVRWVDRATGRVVRDVAEPSAAPAE